MSDPNLDRLQSLPHGPEFRFLDSITELDPGVFGRATYKVRGDEAFLKGHFPGNPLFPGVLLVEAAAQLVGTIAQTDPSRTASSLLKLAAIRNAKFKGTVLPGQTILLEARLTGRLGPAIQGEARAFVETNEIMTCQVTLSGS